MKKVLVVAPVLSKSGYGVHSRFVIDALSSRPDLYDVYVSPLNWGRSSWLHEDNFKRKYYNFLIQKAASYQGEFDVSIQVTVPTEWKGLAKINIGITAGVETDRVPLDWLRRANSMDKIIVTSAHTADTFLKTKYDIKNEHTDEVLSLVGCQKPVEVVTYPVRNIVPVDLSEKIKLPTDFNFLSITQMAPRKNIEDALKWFVEEFREEENVGLLLKAHGENNSIPDRYKSERLLKGFIEQLGPRKCKIYHIHGAMSDEELHGLYVHPQMSAYLTATHGEGFGLPIFESAYSGLPVIAPAWSGHVDFLSTTTKNKAGKIKRETCYEKVAVDIVPVPEIALMPGIITKDMNWCRPKEDKFKRAMRSVFTELKAKKTTANRLQTHILETFSEENQHKAMSDAIWSGIENETTRWAENMETVQKI